MGPGRDMRNQRHRHHAMMTVCCRYFSLRVLSHAVTCPVMKKFGAGAHANRETEKQSAHQPDHTVHHVSAGCVRTVNQSSNHLMLTCQHRSVESRAMQTSLKITVFVTWDISKHSTHSQGHGRVLFDTPTTVPAPTTTLFGS